MSAVQEMTLFEFEKRLLAFQQKLGVTLYSLPIDHISLRTNSRSTANLWLAHWKTRGQVLSNANINGRPIYILAFNEPLQLVTWKIPCLELPFPAQGKHYHYEGWEHVEFVVPSQATNCEDFLQDLFSSVPELKKAWGTLDEMGVKAKLSSPKGENERLANPTVALKWDGICIKFHPHSISDIIRSEQND